MKLNYLVFIVLLIIVTNIFGNLNADDEKISIFIDYEYGDLNFIKEKITCVNYVRYKNEADVFILFTKQSTGSNGKKITIDFTGMKRFIGIDETLSYDLDPGATAEVGRAKSVHTIELGLIRYLSRTDIADRLEVVLPVEKVTDNTIDKWNNWVFRISLSGFLSGEETSNSQNFWGNIRSTRITDKMKVQFRVSGSINRDKFEWDDEVYKSSSESKSFNAHLVKSWTDHLSYGLWTYIYSSSFSNVDLSYGLYPGIEYNIYPYSEANRKQFRFQYQLNPNHVDYLEETIYEKNSENLLKHSFTSELEFIQTWGSIEFSLTASQYLIIDNKLLNNLEKNKLTIDSDLSWRVYKGLSLNLWGFVSRIHDQLSLAAGDISTEDLLLKRKELQTQYTYFLSIGISYSFGSIYNNIVNPRFGD